MRTKLKISAVIVLLITSAVSLTRAQAPLGSGAMAVNPGVGFAGGPPAVDPATGQPVSQAENWKDSNWHDPDIVLTNVNFDGLPLTEVALYVREQFKNQIDVILPTAGSPPGGLNQRTGLPMGPESIDVNASYAVRLQLKNVSASELFNAMNLLFENDATPLRWELKLVGKRQMAFLHVLIQPMPAPTAPPAAPAPATQRRVYFVGNLIGDEKNGGMTMEQIISTVVDVGKMAGVNGGNLQFHKDAQLIIVSGSPDQIDFMEQTLKALAQKEDLKRSQLARPEHNAVKPATPVGN